MTPLAGLDPVGWPQAGVADAWDEDCQNSCGANRRLPAQSGRIHARGLALARVSL